MRYFKIAEFVKSDTATRLKIKNEPGKEEIANIERLVTDVLDPLREAWGRPLIVTSGYRCAALNKAVGGTITSHHLRGMAADVTTGNEVDNRRLYELVLRLNLPFTQLIGKRYGFKWLHIGYNPTDVRHEFF